jgi:hypothetical protein
MNLFRAHGVLLFVIQPKPLTMKGQHEQTVNVFPTISSGWATPLVVDIIVSHLRKRDVLKLGLVCKLLHARTLKARTIIKHKRWERQGLPNLARHGDLQGVKYLVNKGVALDGGANLRSEDEEDALQRASEKGHLEVVKYLVEECRANVHADNDWALRLASENGHLEVVKYLVLNGGANVHALNDDALHVAMMRGNLAIVQCLVEEGDANVFRWDGIYRYWMAGYDSHDVLYYVQEKRNLF